MQNKIEFFSNIPLFSKESRRNISTLIYHFSPITAIKNQIIYKEGEIADSIYIIRKGEVKILKKFEYPKEDEEDEDIIVKSQLPKKKNFEVIFFYGHIFLLITQIVTTYDNPLLGQLSVVIEFS